MTVRTLRILSTIVCAALVSVLFTVASIAADERPASALSGSDFQAGNIISDQNFFNANSMSENDVQQFLNSKSCSPRDGVLCLRDYRVTTPTTPAVGPGHCSQYTGGTNESAARIIWKVGQACGISPAVLLVLLQKEQSLITNPSAYGYQRAMGWGCPDSGPGGTANCDANYFGLYNQVYKSAWQFRQYTLYPVNIPGGGTRQYRIGNVYVQYNPDTSCGGSNVNIVNQATANLYLYTPYQPNAAALANLYGSGDGCSAYGNRNFWRLYSDWFGSPTGNPGVPVANLESLTFAYNRIMLSGWALDMDSPQTALTLDIQVDTKWYQLTANQSRPDVGAQYPSAGPNHGFSGTIPSTKGPHVICIYVQNVGPGSTLSLGCRNIVVPDESPAGAITSISPVPAGIALEGWAVDPDALSASVVMDVQVGSKWYVWTANTSSAAGGAAYPGAGNNHGFKGTVPSGIGNQTVCIYLRNQNLGSNSSIPCQTINVPDSPAQGELQTVVANPGGVTVSGWAVDPDSITTALTVDVQVNSAWYRLTANGNAPIANQKFPGAGNNHGFSGTLPAANGSNTVCIYVKNSDGGAPEASLGCRTVSVTGGGDVAPGPPQGAILGLTGGAGVVNLSGWAVDPDILTQPVKVDIQAGGKWYLWNADQTSPEALAKFPTAGPNHGFNGTIPSAAGPNTVCVYLQNVGQGSATSLGCKTVTVTAPPVEGGSPKGGVMSLDGGVGKISLTGWAVDPDVPTQPVKVDVQIAGPSGQWILLTADKPGPEGEIALPGSGPNHGFAGSVDVSPGSYTVCVYLQNVGVGSPTGLGCRQVTVTAPAPASGSPQGAVTGLSVAAGSFTLSGWGVDPDILTQPVKVDVQVAGPSGQWLLWNADQPDTFAEAAFPGAGSNHAFTGTVQVASGKYTICTYLQNVGPGSATSLGCQAITVP